MNARLFLALWPDAPEREVLASWRDAWTWPARAEAVADAKLHLTLHFIGDVPVARLPEIRAGLAVPCPPFTIRIDQPAQWHAGIAVLEATSVPPELLQLHAALSERLLDLGLRLEVRPYKPHVTMARRAAGAIPPPDKRWLPWSIRGYSLVRSDGGHYQVLEQY